MNAQKYISIIFGFILFAAVVYGGITIVRSYSSSANRDQLMSTLYDLGITAQKYFNEPVAKGGGGHSFSGWKLPESLSKTEYGSFAGVTRNKRIDICGIGTQTGRNGFTTVRITARIDSVGINVTVVN